MFDVSDMYTLADAWGWTWERELDNKPPRRWSQEWEVELAIKVMQKASNCLCFLFFSTATHGISYSCFLELLDCGSIGLFITSFQGILNIPGVLSGDNHLFIALKKKEKDYFDVCLSACRFLFKQCTISFNFESLLIYYEIIVIYSLSLLTLLRLPLLLLKV